MNQEAFAVLVDRARTGDQTAAAELVRRFEPQIRRAIRLRMTDPRLDRLLDSGDVCQSVLARFFGGLAEGRIELDSPGQLVKLLLAMASNRLIDWARHEQAARRDQRRREALPDDAGAPIAPGPTPSQVVAGQELISRLHAALSPEERRLAELRASGASWDEIAVELCQPRDALKKRFYRALDRVLDRVDRSRGD